MYGSMFNHLMDSSSNPAPAVGMGATELLYSDRHAVTIIEVSKSGKQLVVQRDKATRTDSHGMSDAQSYAYEADPEGARRTYTLRKNGRWVSAGSNMHSGISLSIGHRSEYYDFTR